MVEVTDYCGIVSGKRIDKSEILKLSMENLKRLQ